MTLDIPTAVLRAAKLPSQEVEDEFRKELALALYERGVLSLGKARGPLQISGVRETRFLVFWCKLLSVILQTGEYYHLYNRGNNYQPVFFERENYLYFLRQLRKYLTVEIIAYCLMPNHYHLLAHLKTDDLSSLMQPFILAYTKAINKRYGRVGSLFQGRFEAVHVDRDEYLLHLSRYIHLNPVMDELVKRSQDWEFSSYPEYIGLRNGTLPRPEVVLSQFPSLAAYRHFVEAYVESDREVIEDLIFE